MRTVRIISVVVLLVALTPMALADVVHLKDGGKTEGQIVSDDGKTDVVKTRFGEVKVERSRIARISRAVSVA